MLPVYVYCLFLAYQIFYRSYVNRQHFRLRSFASLCSAVQYFWGRRSFQIRYAAHFLHGLAMILLRDNLSVRSFLIAAMTRYSGFVLLSLVTRFACDIGQLAKIGFEFHLRSSPSAFSGFVNISQPAEYFTACYIVLKRPNKVETAVHNCNLAFSLDSIVSLPR